MTAILFSQRGNPLHCVVAPFTEWLAVFVNYRKWPFSTSMPRQTKTLELIKALTPIFDYVIGNTKHALFYQDRPDDHSPLMGEVDQRIFVSGIYEQPTPGIRLLYIIHQSTDLAQEVTFGVFINIGTL
jgi:hypothetical protein